MWDPQAYLNYDELRARPFHELLARVRARQPRRVVDAGCGPGTLTAELRRRWPDATVEAFDSSPDMVAAARDAGVTARVLDVTAWEPRPDTDVVVANAVLQWVPEHRELLCRWAGELPRGAWLAMQVPGNMAAPSHRVVRELAASERWAPLLRDVRMRGAEAVGEPRDYADLIADEGCAVDAWETTYLHRLSGPDPVLNWITGTALRPVVAALDPAAWEDFRADLAPLLRAAYPPRADGTTWFPFRRIFVVARTGG
ncbi:trans-aconitate 2-methyltransferase [Saccharomonospora piscinae]|uniref:trans-aconitate 2-methyltransferase n=1 Tax=Saccharomonospora piscinae TaxID=687388 RepID=UPI0004668CC0|nr:trans-aconitate 2-methyltransferase [Saccharomonospora piscinae]